MMSLDDVIKKRGVGRGGARGGRGGLSRGGRGGFQHGSQISRGGRGSFRPIQRGGRLGGVPRNQMVSFEYSNL